MGTWPGLFLGDMRKCTHLLLHSSQFVDCLGEMALTKAVEGEGSDILDYTRLWFDKVNRGGLYPINNEAFALCSNIKHQTSNIVLETYYLSTFHRQVRVKVRSQKWYTIKF